MNSLSADFKVTDYDLDATLASGQAFRWRRVNGVWEGVVTGRWVQLQMRKGVIHARTAVPVADWSWLRNFLQLDVNLLEILSEFPVDPSMQAAVKACHGLRILRQEPWECLASFICSSTKQIVQIEQIIAQLCSRLGEAVAVPEGHAPAYAFPHWTQIAQVGEAALRECKMGFRAPYVLGTARTLAAGEIDLEALRGMTLAEAREQLLRFPGVGRKIADCVLLFGYGFEQAFPVDVWILRALRQLYFSRRRVKPARLLRFTETYFGRYAGHAQQYLFHYMRVVERETKPEK